MKYFEQFNIININDEKLRDLFFKVYADIFEDNQIVNYTISDYETIKDLSYKFYGSVDLWWIIAILNNIYDLNFDWILTNEEINNIAREKATNESGTLNETDFLKYFDELSEENDKKRIIKLLKPEYLSNFMNSFLNTKNEIEDNINNESIKQASITLQNVNYKIIKGNIFDVTLPLCGNTYLNVYDIEVVNVLNSIILSWKLPPNNDDYHGIWIVDNGESIALLDATARAYAITPASVGEHEIHIILIEKNRGVETSCDIFVPLPSISVDVDKMYFEGLDMELRPTATGGLDWINWECLQNINYLQFYNYSPPILSGNLREQDTQRVTFIATDRAGRFDRKTVDININRFPQLSYDVANEYHQNDNISLEPILTYGYGVRNYSINSLPSGLTMSNSGVISGVLTQIGVFDINVNMIDGKNRQTSYSFTLKIIA